MIPKETIEEIFRTARIEEVIEDFLPLKKAGSDLKAHSPFSNEKTPSFMVSPAKQIFKDFSSGKGGNVVTFLMEHEQLSYPEALRYLAQRYNIEIPEADDEEAQQEQREKEALFIVSEFAERYFKEQLHETDEGRSVGLQYLRERGFDEDIIEAFGLGFAPKEWEKLTRTALDKGYKLDLLQKTGLTKVKEEKRFDFFRERVIFPIHDITGRTVGFGGRLLREDQKAPKYLNSPESPIYDKGRVLYGLYQAKKQIAHDDRCYLVEGYTDVIALHQAGVKNVAATSGTALSKEQVRLIRRFTQHVTLLFDGDEAGQKATERGMDIFLQEGMNVKILMLPEGEDPDSFSKEREPEELKEYFEKEGKDLIRYKAELLAEEAKDDPVEKSKLLKGVTDSISLIPDHILRSFYIRECSQTLDVDEQALVMEVNKARRKRLKSERERKEEDEAISEEEPATSKPQPRSEISSPFPQEQELIRLMIEYSNMTLPVTVEYEESGEEQEEDVPLPAYIINELDADGIVMEDRRHRRIFELFREMEGEKPDPPQVMERLLVEDPELQEYAAQISTSKEEISPKWKEKHHVHIPSRDENLLRGVKNGINALKEKRIESKLKELQEKFNKVEDQEEEEQLLWEQSRLIEAKKEFNKELGRVVIR